MISLSGAKIEGNIGRNTEKIFPQISQIYPEEKKGGPADLRRFTQKRKKGVPRIPQIFAEEMEVPADFADFRRRKKGPADFADFRRRKKGSRGSRRFTQRK
jgi:hypothetical protein